MSLEPDTPQGQTDPESSPNADSFLARRLASLSVTALLIFLFLYGCCISGLVLKEPDICFLLGGGRWIVEHGQIPSVDPFSYTTHYHWAQYVVEKWLTEVVFYLILPNWEPFGCSCSMQ